MISDDIKCFFKIGYESKIIFLVEIALNEADVNLVLLWHRNVK